MIDSAAGVVGCLRIVDAGRCGPKGNSATWHGPLRPVPAGAARRGQTTVPVVESVIYAPSSLAASRRVLTSAVGFFCPASSSSLLRLTQMTGTLSFRHGSTSW
jgi:hypothetical protein